MSDSVLHFEIQRLCARLNRGGLGDVEETIFARHLSELKAEAQRRIPQKRPTKTQKMRKPRP